MTFYDTLHLDNLNQDFKSTSFPNIEKIQIIKIILV